MKKSFLLSLWVVILSALFVFSSVLTNSSDTALANGDPTETPWWTSGGIPTNSQFPPKGEFLTPTPNPYPEPEPIIEPYPAPEKEVPFTIPRPIRGQRAKNEIRRMVSKSS